MAELRRDSLAASLGAATGEGLNKAIMDVLNNITKNKVRDVESRHLGSPPPQNPTLEALSTISEQPQPNPMEQLQQNRPQEQSIQNALQSLQSQEDQSEALKPKNQEKPQPQVGKNRVDSKGLSKEGKAASQKAIKLIEKPTKLSPASKVADKIDENPDPIEHKAVERKQDAKIKKLPKLSEKQQLAADKETKGYFDETSKAAKAAKDGNMRLDRMIELIKDGNLNWPSIASFIDTIDRGIPLFGSHIGYSFHWLENQQTHEFRKLSSDFVKNAKDIFGGRITNLDLESYLKTIPNVGQTDQGKIAVIRNMRLLNAGALVRKKAMDEIIADNDGQRPPNLESLVEERASDQLDALAEKFRKGIYEDDEAQANFTAHQRKIFGVF